MISSRLNQLGHNLVYPTNVVLATGGERTGHSHSHYYKIIPINFYFYRRSNVRLNYVPSQKWDYKLHKKSSKYFYLCKYSQKVYCGGIKV